MITAKFGGTAITPRNLLCVRKIISNRHNAVVVSAIGKEYPNDDKTTDLLLTYFKERDDKIWERISLKYRAFTERNAINADVDELLYSAKKRALNFDLNYCASLGEEMAAKLTAAYLSAEYIEAQNAIFFSERGNLKYGETLRALKQAFSGRTLGVIGGFYGGCKNGRRTFSRGGSDVTGALVAVALNSELYENWTDSYGVCAANPGAVGDVATIERMSYDEMRLLSLSGAEVLHPDAVIPVQKAAIPIKIGNYYNPDGKSTIISNCVSKNRLLSIAEKNEGGKTVATVLYNGDSRFGAEIVSSFFVDNFTELNFFGKSVRVEKVKIYSVVFEKNLIRITANRSVARDLYKRFTDTVD